MQLNKQQKKGRNQFNEFLLLLRLTSYFGAREALDETLTVDGDELQQQAELMQRPWKSKDQIGKLHFFQRGHNGGSSRYQLWVFYGHNYDFCGNNFAFPMYF